MLKFALVLSSRYPSEKAYSVTTTETARAANDSGFHTLIFAPTDAPEKNLISLNNRTIKLLSMLMRTKNLSNKKILFQLRRLAVAREFRRINRKEYSSRVVWTRDPIVALLVPKNQQLVLELHHKPTKYDSQVCKILNLRQNLVVCTLTKVHRKKLQPLFTNHEIVVTPMAVNDDFFRKEDRQFVKERIVFLGKGWSSGHDNNLIKIIEELAIYKKRFSQDLNFHFLGLEDDYQNVIRQKIVDYDLQEDSVTFTSHVLHSEVPELLKDVSIGLIPYEYSPYNNQRFPIKALEYAAARITILATNIPINREILGNEFCYFYSPDCAGDLSRVLKEIFDDLHGRQIRIQKAYEWATRHTYRNRISVILDSLSELN